MRAVDFRRALGDEYFTEVFRVAEQVGIHRIVAGIVDRDTVRGHTDLIGVHPAHGEAGAAHARGVGAGDVDAGGVLEFVDGVGSGCHFVHRLFGYSGAALGAVFFDHQAIAQTLPGDIDLAYINGIFRQRR